MPASKVEVDVQRLNRILKNLPGKREDNNRAIAFRIEGRAKAKAPVDTGALRASIYTDCAGQQSGEPGNAPLPKPKGDDAHVGPSMDYALYVEFGTRRAGAQPYLVPAVRETEDQLAQVWGNIAD
jgi:HK97 gp10 family phage protein